MLCVSSHNKKDILVTTPKSEMQSAKSEAEQCLKNGGGFYFRHFSTCPKQLEVGSKIFYVEDGHIRGFGVVDKIEHGPKVCETTGKSWGDGICAMMLAESWKWIKPIAMKGFQGYRYYDGSEAEIVGDWKSPKPDVVS